ncbi:MAG: hypothetical protein WKF84_02070 [Pyrinomonadaceae bacterium]
MQVTPDGRYVVFQSYAVNLVPDDTNNLPDIFVKDLSTGAVDRVSVATDGAQASGEFAEGSSQPSISADGRFVSFISDTVNLNPDRGRTRLYYVHDRLTGVTEAITANADANVDDSTGKSSLSADGRYIAYETVAGIEVARPSIGERPIHRRQRSSNQRGRPVRRARGISPARRCQRLLRRHRCLRSADRRHRVGESNHVGRPDPGRTQLELHRSPPTAGTSPSTLIGMHTWFPDRSTDLDPTCSCATGCSGRRNMSASAPPARPEATGLHPVHQRERPLRIVLLRIKQPRAERCPQPAGLSPRPAGGHDRALERVEQRHRGDAAGR